MHIAQAPLEANAFSTYFGKTNARNFNEEFEIEELRDESFEQNTQ